MERKELWETARMVSQQINFQVLLENAITQSSASPRVSYAD